METKSLLYGLIGFFAGGLIVSLVAMANNEPNYSGMMNDSANGEMTMSMMTDRLEQKTGDAYDEAFISYMIMHHQAAIDMAKLSKEQAKHDEVKSLSQDILSTQSKEIGQMKQWQARWNYDDLTPSGMMTH